MRPVNRKRVPLMLEYLAAGDTFEDLLAEFPDLESAGLIAKNNRLTSCGMGTVNYTTPSSASSELHDAHSGSLELTLPDGESFRSLPPRVSLVAMMKRNRELRRWVPSGLPRAEER